MEGNSPLGISGFGRRLCSPFGPVIGLYDTSWLAPIPTWPTWLVASRWTLRFFLCLANIEQNPKTDQSTNLTNFVKKWSIFKIWHSRDRLAPANECVWINLSIFPLSLRRVNFLQVYCQGIVALSPCRKQTKYLSLFLKLIYRFLSRGVLPCRPVTSKKIYIPLFWKLRYQFLSRGLSPCRK